MSWAAEKRRDTSPGRARSYSTPPSLHCASEPHGAGQRLLQGPPPLSASSLTAPRRHAPRRRKLPVVVKGSRTVAHGSRPRVRAAETAAAAVNGMETQPPTFCNFGQTIILFRRLYSSIYCSVMSSGSLAALAVAIMAPLATHAFAPSPAARPLLVRGGAVLVAPLRHPPRVPAAAPHRRRAWRAQEESSSEPPAPPAQDRAPPVSVLQYVWFLLALPAGATMFPALVAAAEVRGGQACVNAGRHARTDACAEKRGPFCTRHAVADGSTPWPTAWALAANPDT